MPTQDKDTLLMITQLREELTALKRRVGELEGWAAKAARAVPSEEEMMAMAAALAAFLGVRARIRQVRLVHSSVWAQVGRIGTHASHHTH